MFDFLKKNKYTFYIGKLVSIFYYDIIIDSVDLLKVKLRYLGLLNEKKYESICSLKNAHKGERCFIVATGPSLTIEDLMALQGEVVMGVNSLVKLIDKLPYEIKYFGIQDSLVYNKIGSLIERSSLKTVFVTDKIYAKSKQLVDNKYIRFPLYSCRHAIHGEMMPLASGFTNDPSKVVYSGYSITFSMLQIAVYMGFSEIYLLGCDCNYDTRGGNQHFVESGHVDKYASSVGERMIYAYKVAKEWLENNRPDVKVYNATRGGMLEVFPRKTVDQVIK